MQTRRKRDIKIATLAVVFCGFAVQHPVWAESVGFSQFSTPPGIISNVWEAPVGEITNTVTAPASSGSLKFYGWYDQYEKRYEAVNGTAENPAELLITEAMTLTARYMDAAVDSDGDGVPDWYELYYYGNTDQAASSDSDGDGYALYEEWYRGYDPHATEPVAYRCRERASPAMLAQQVETIVDGGVTNYAGASCYGERDGYRFSYWTVNGVAARDSLGRAFDPLVVGLEPGTRFYDMAACFVPMGLDSDQDGVADWYEKNYYADVQAAGAGDDEDGDGWDLRTEFAHDTHPRLADQIVRHEAVGADSQGFDFLYCGDFNYSQYSSPTGCVAYRAEMMSPGSVVTAAAPVTNGNLHFTGWALNGQMQTNASGAATNVVVFNIFTDTVAVAYFMDAAVDSDGDSVPDWYELYYYGNTDQAASSDSDGDGYTLYEEWYRGYDPHATNPPVFRCRERASPAMLAQQVETIVDGGVTNYAGASCYGERNGYRFSCWMVNGVAARDSLGRALDPLVVGLAPGTWFYDMVACFDPMGLDSDQDGVADWYEKNYYADVQVAGAGDDEDGDGWNLRTEFAHDTHPRLADQIVRHEAVGAVSKGFDFLYHGDFSYSEYSSPTGCVAYRSGMMSPGSVVTAAAPVTNGNLHFTGWALNGQMQTNAGGAATNVVVFNIFTDTVAVAYFMDATVDSDRDGVPDWYELYYYGNTDQTASSDSDGDGYILYEEWYRGYDPHATEPVAYRCRERASPAMLAQQVETIVDGGVTNYAGASCYGERDGYRFSYWTVNGVAMRDNLGRAFDPLMVGLEPVTRFYDMAACFVPMGLDSDQDGVADWYEKNYYVDVQTAGAGDDEDGDGWNLRTEFAHDTHPRLADQIVRHEAVGAECAMEDFWYRFYFSSESYVQCDGVLTNFFGGLPPAKGMFDMGTNSAPGLGDWDGDGDLDLFVMAPGQAMKVYENVAGRYYMNFVDRSSAFNVFGNDFLNPSLTLGDWNGDNRADLAIGTGNGRVRLISSAGVFGGTVGGGVDYSIDTGMTNAIPALGEFTGDGRLDMLVLLPDGSVRLYPGSADPLMPFNESVFTNNILGIAVPSATGIAAADVDYDQHIDVLVSDDEGRIWVFYGRGNGTYQLLSKVWAGTYSGFAGHLTLALGDLDGDTDIDMIGGYAQGGLIRLIDPRLIPPVKVIACGGAGSVKIEWQPNREQGLAGYFVYRSNSASGQFDKMFENVVMAHDWVDTNIQAGATCCYYVTAVTDRRQPGAPLPVYLESRPSNVASATCANVAIWMPDYRAGSNSIALLPVNIKYGQGISGCNLNIRITYDPAIMTPFSQINRGAQTVGLTELSRPLTVSDNAETADGELKIEGSAGEIAGDGCLFNIKFYVTDRAAVGSVWTNTFAGVHLERADGMALGVDYSDTATLTVSPVYGAGDVNGDGIVNDADLACLILIIGSETGGTPEELVAGDLNGDGCLDHADAQLLIRMLRAGSGGSAGRQL